jgi:hypothetical protein
MSVLPLPGPDQPDPEAAHALRLIGTVVEELPLARDQFQAALHDAAGARQLNEEAQAAQKQASQAQARVAAGRLAADSRHRFPRMAGTMLAVVLAVLDAVPAYWSAQAFGLDQTSTLVITVLLCAALGGGMWLLELFNSQRRRRALRILQACLAGGLLALFALRLDYLQVTAAVGFWLAVIQAFALTSMSAVLIVIGYVLLDHRVPKALADSQRAARQVAPDDAVHAAEAAHTQASKSRAALDETLVTWALTHPQDGIGHDQLLPALRQALDSLLNQ